MEKIELTVLGLSASPAGNNAYALILKETNGKRRLPIIIGAFEAQAIALEMEGVEPPRPMTHDLFKNFIKNEDNDLIEVYINDLSDGTFFARMIFAENDFELDARPSDAVAMAVRFSCPIYVSAELLEETGILPQDEEENELLEGKATQFPSSKAASYENKVDRLQSQLDKAISSEDYEKAAALRDEIKKLLESQ